MTKSDSIQERLEAKRRIDAATGCWLWTGAVFAAGYGLVHMPGRKGKTRGTHRVAWEIYRGPIPDGLFVLRRCDTPACFNPDHLFIGTQKDNIRDMHEKGRSNGQRKTHCIRGHKLAGDNLLIQGPNKARACYTCKLMLNRKYYQKRRANK